MAVILVVAVIVLSFCVRGCGAVSPFVNLYSLCPFFCQEKIGLFAQYFVTLLVKD